MRIEEIRKLYPDEWVLIEYSKLDDDLNVLEGEVIAHSADKEEIYQAQMKVQGRSLAIEYLGEIPEQDDLVVVL